MDIIFKVFLIIHIISGAVGLFSGLLNVMRKKGDKLHVMVGRIFYISMLITGFSSFVLSILHTNYFLFMVAVFTLYMVSTGKRYISMKMHHDDPLPNWIDWSISIVMFIVGVVFMGLGATVLLRTNLFGLVFLLFGMMGVFFVFHDFKNYRGKSRTKNYWLLAHLQRMMGGFIASFTAFLVVNASYLPTQIPGFIYWLLPTFIFTPFIIAWSRKYEVKK